MPELTPLLQSLNFPSMRQITGRTSIADLFHPGERCGIYILHFQHGELYAGQAVDVTRRYVQHCKTHEDIAAISFKRVAREKLNEEERSIIWELERRGFPLRNISLTSIPKGDSDFDLVMPAGEQQRWLDDLNYQDFSGTRAQDEALRRKYQRKFQRLLKLPQADAAIEFLRCYVQRGIPVPVRSELSFWACSCLPPDKDPEVKVYARININWQEVLTVAFYEGAVTASFHLAASPLKHITGSRLRRFMMYRKYGALFDKHRYRPGGQDQLAIHITGTEAATRLLENEDVIRAIRLFNIRLMKKGPCNFSRYHCMDLADRLIC